MMYIQIGFLAVQAEWIALTGSVFLSALFFKLYDKNSLDWLINAFLVLVLIWKASFLIVEWDMEKKSLYSLLYYNGGTAGYILGALGSSIYLFFSKAPKLKVQHSFILYLVLISAYQAILIAITFGEPADFIQFAVNVVFLLVVPLFFRSLTSQTAFQLTVIAALWNVLAYSYSEELLSLSTFTAVWVPLTLQMISKKGR